MRLNTLPTVLFAGTAAALAAVEPECAKNAIYDCFTHSLSAASSFCTAHVLTDEISALTKTSTVIITPTVTIREWIAEETETVWTTVTTHDEGEQKKSVGVEDVFLHKRRRKAKRACRTRPPSCLASLTVDSDSAEEFTQACTCIGLTPTTPTAVVITITETAAPTDVTVTATTTDTVTSMTTTATVNPKRTDNPNLDFEENWFRFWTVNTGDTFLTKKASTAPDGGNEMAVAKVKTMPPHYQTGMVSLRYGYYCIPGQVYRLLASYSLQPTLPENASHTDPGILMSITTDSGATLLIWQTGDEIPEGWQRVSTLFACSHDESENEIHVYIEVKPNGGEIEVWLDNFEIVPVYGGLSLTR